MAAMHKIAAIFGILCCIQLIVADLRSLTKSQNFENSFVLVNPQAIDETTITFIACEGSNKESANKCTVIQEYNDKNEKKASCVLNLMNKDGSSRPKLTQLESDKVVIISQGTSDESGQNVKFTTIKLSTCKTIEEEIVLPKSDRKFNIHFTTVSKTDNGFEVIFRSELCEDKFCKLTFDNEGKKVGSPVNTIHDEDNFMFAMIEKVPTKSASNKYLLLTASRDGTKAFLANDEDKTKLLEIESNRGGTAAFSTANNLVGVCLQGETISCTQFDQDGKIKVEVPVAPVDGKRDLIFGNSLHNLPGGGFLKAEMNGDSYAVRKLSADKQHDGVAEFTGFSCPDNGKNFVQGKFVQPRDGKYCLFLVCSSLHDNSSDAGNLQLTAKCYTDNDFSK